MAVPLAALIVIFIALLAGAFALSAFIWAVRTKQFSIQQLNKGAYLVFDEEEPAGTPQDMLFGSPDHPRAGSSSPSESNDHGTTKT
jgi:cbb3-type cytochrome oxidase maturation protein